LAVKKKVTVFRCYKRRSGRTILITPHFLVTCLKIVSEPNGISDQPVWFHLSFLFWRVGGREVSSNLLLRSIPKIWAKSRTQFLAIWIGGCFYFFILTDFLRILYVYENDAFIVENMQWASDAKL
jgi:hypothetical protein